MSSLVFAPLALSACRRSNVSSMVKFMTGIVLLALVPVLIGTAIHFGDLFIYVSSAKRSAAAETMSTWKVYNCYEKSFYIVSDNG